MTKAEAAYDLVKHYRQYVTQDDIRAAKEYLQGVGPWRLDEIGITADDYLVLCFTRHRIRNTPTMEDN